jgi:hypothetical protein
MFADTCENLLNKKVMKDYIISTCICQTQHESIQWFPPVPVLLNKIIVQQNLVITHFVEFAWIDHL